MSVAIEQPSSESLGNTTSLHEGTKTQRLARPIIKDLFVHREWIYWVDMLATMAVGYGAASVYLLAPLFSWQQIVSYFIAGFALFRLGSFIHEITHLRQKELRFFKVGWNVLAGIPMLMPSFFYGNHIDHHSDRHFGTGQDGEYLPLGSGTLGHVIKFLAQVLFLPGWVAIRFLIITPISFLHPKLRQWALEHWSSFVINLRYRREIPANAPRFWWAILEIACSIRAWLIFAVVFTGFAPWYRIPALYMLGMLAMGLNYVRNLVAHHYRSDGQPMTHEDQLRDSVNITGDFFFTELFFPLGLRFHALHHLFPALPYHNLGIAHRRLMKELPADSLYRKTVYSSFWGALRDLWSDTREAKQTKAARAEEWFQRRRELLARRKAKEQAAVARS